MTISIHRVHPIVVHCHNQRVDSNFSMFFFLTVFFTFSGFLVLTTYRNESVASSYKATCAYYNVLCSFQTTTNIHFYPCTYSYILFYC